MNRFTAHLTLTRQLLLSTALTPCLLANELPPITAPLGDSDPSATEVNRAQKILHAWESDTPQKASRTLKIVYWTPADRDPQPDYQARLTRVMKHIQSFYLNQLEQFGFPNHSIQLDLSPDQSLHIYLSKGTLKSDECNEQDQSIGQKIRTDCLKTLAENGINGDNETMVIFCNLSDWDAEKRTMGHHSPYYAAGTSASGTAWQVDSPLLDSALLNAKEPFLTDSQYGKISVGRYNSIFVGGVAHELGHALGLPHCRECKSLRERRGTALMGSGNRTYGENLRNEGKGTFLTLGHALKLAAHPQFSGSVKQLTTPANVSFKNLQFKNSPTGLEISGAITANLPCHAIIGYADPQGGGDYDSAISCGVPQSDGTFRLHLPLTDAQSKPAVLSLVGVCANGAATAGVWSQQAFSLPCMIDAKGLYDPSPAIASSEVTNHLMAARNGALTKEVSDTLTPTARECLARLSKPENANPKISPAEAPDTLKTLALSDANPSHASTGYGGVHYDRTPDQNPLISPLGPAAHGIWAHAPSTFTYPISGKWKKLSGKCALLQTGSGPIQATITADGKTIWQSSVLQQGMFQSFDLPIESYQSLSFTIKGVNGNGSTHGAWIEPTLSR